MIYLTDLLLQESVDCVFNNDGNVSAAARELKIARTTLTVRLEAANRRQIIPTEKQRETLQGINPQAGLTHAVPQPFILDRYSTYYNKKGDQSGQWIKAKASDISIQRMIETTIKTLSKGFEGASPLIPSPKHKNKDLLNCTILGDPHFGLYSWGEESGDDFDTKIASQITLSAVDRLTTSAPPANTALLLSVGDTFHGDNQSNVTPTNGYQLDCDTRFAKVIEITIQAFRHCIIRLLQKHQNVIVRFVKGNHDPHSHLTLAFALRGYFSNNKRVLIDLSPAALWYYRFAKVLIGSTHGDKTKPSQLLGAMVADRPIDVGLTEHRYFYTGHIHNKSVHEFSGLTVESFQTLAPADAHSASHAYRSQRSMICIVHHAEHGEIERHRCGISMI